jgi:hypothetical protein
VSRLHSIILALVGVLASLIKRWLSASLGEKAYIGPRKLLYRSVEQYQSAR